MSTQRNFILIVCLLFFLALAYPANTTAQQPTHTKTHHDKKLGITFQYSSVLTVDTKHGNVIMRALRAVRLTKKDWQRGKTVISHEITFKHDNPCDGSGLYPTLKRITDFYVAIEVVPGSITPGIRDDGENVTYGILRGRRFYNGNHGCGPFTYWFKLPGNKFLRVEYYPTPEFSGEVPANEREIYRHIKDIIPSEDAERMFTELLRSIQLTGSR